MGLEGAHAVIEVTGGYPVYPGHPLTVAWEIMTVFQSAKEALQTVTTNGLNCPEAVADDRISGGGGEVHRACDLLRLAQQGASASELMQWADEKWIDGQAGGHVKAIQPGLAQAAKIKPLFEQKLVSWLAAGAAPICQERRRSARVRAVECGMVTIERLRLTKRGEGAGRT